jgi:hypothetical protein
MMGEGGSTTVGADRKHARLPSLTPLIGGSAAKRSLIAARGETREAPDR